ncbi:MAG: hypothetical protein JEY94_01485 [Melioribacteraceae bacterium]|nr:hypothetical protein [Melioribacteraceae bacterium]
MKFRSMIYAMLILVICFFNSCKKNAKEDNDEQKSSIVYKLDFEDEYGTQEWIKKNGIPYIDRKDKAQLVKNDLNDSKVLRLKYDKGGIGPKETGTSFPVKFASIDGMKETHFTELYLKYYLKFEEGFDFRLGGKLPGLMGGGDSWTRSGGQQPDGTNGWTLRFMWREGGAIVVYAYLPKSENGKYGGRTWGQDIDCDFIAEPGKWICIEEYANVGTPGKDDGTLKVWINREEKLNINDLRFRNVENNIGKIGGFYFSTFHGGNTKDWAPRHDSYAQFDEFIITKKRFGGITK